MAYPLMCAAHYPIPIKPGKNKITKVIAAVSDRSADSRLTLIDDHEMEVGDKQGTVKSTKTSDHSLILDLKGIGGAGPGFLDSGPLNIKLRDGVNAVDCTNLQAGSIAIYCE